MDSILELEGLVSPHQLAIEVVILISLWVDCGMNFIGRTGDAQGVAVRIVLLALRLMPAFIPIIGMAYMPFSHR